MSLEDVFIPKEEVYPNILGNVLAPVGLCTEAGKTKARLAINRVLLGSRGNNDTCFMIEKPDDIDCVTWKVVLNEYSSKGWDVLLLSGEGGFQNKARLTVA